MVVVVVVVVVLGVVLGGGGGGGLCGLLLAVLSSPEAASSEAAGGLVFRRSTQHLICLDGHPISSLTSSHKREAKACKHLPGHSVTSAVLVMEPSNPVEKSLCHFGCFIVEVERLHCEKQLTFCQLEISKVYFLLGEIIHSSLIHSVIK